MAILHMGSPATAVDRFAGKDVTVLGVVLRIEDLDSRIPMVAFAALGGGADAMAGVDSRDAAYLRGLYPGQTLKLNCNVLGFGANHAPVFRQCSRAS